MTCKDCIGYVTEICDGYTPTDLDKDVWHYCIKGRTDEIPDIEERCDSFKNKADFVEVVRCKDCCNSSEPKSVSRYDLYCNNYDVRFCERDNKIVYGTHYCSYGERK